MQANEGLNRLLVEFAIPGDSPSAQKLKKYLVLLEKWNARINLTARTEWEALEPLFREGIWAARKYPTESRSHLDIGTGAGFPAIVLRIFNPCMNLEMVESRGKKSAFLETVVHELGLEQTQVYSHRLGFVLERTPKNKTWDCISWKAVKLGTDDLMKMCRHTNSCTQFWMFHGKEEAVEEPSVFRSDFNLVRQEQLPGKRESKLSIFEKSYPTKLNR